MPNTPDSPSAALGPMLAEALDRSVETSVDSLVTLRKTVQAYARHQRGKGVTLDAIMRGLSAVLMDVEDSRSSDGSPNNHRDPDLARQLRAWCSDDC